MLVISVIVAVAILGILISIITGLPIIGGDAKSDIQQMLKAVENQGAGNQLKEKTQFAKGILSRGELVQGTTINQKNVQFYCDTASDPSNICSGAGTDSPIQGANGDGPLQINARASAAVAVCKGVNPSNTKFFICIGSPEAATAVALSCSKKCE